MKNRMIESSLSLKEVASDFVEKRYMPISGDIRYEAAVGKMFVRITHSRSDESGWKEIDFGAAYLPRSAINENPISIKDRPELCELIVAASDTYLNRNRGTKSADFMVSDVVRNYYKLFEYAWINGFYNIGDMPQASWDSLCAKLAFGGWVNVLNIAGRTAEALADETIVAADVLSDSKNNRPGSTVERRVSGKFQQLLGTNIVGRELVLPRSMLIKASKSAEIAFSGDLKRFELPEFRKNSTTTLRQITRIFNTVYDVAHVSGVNFIPVPSAWEFARANGRARNRTDNITPDVAASLLTHSFEWVLERGDAIIELVDALGEKLRAFCTENELEKSRWNQHEAFGEFRISCLASLPARQHVEKLVGKSIRYPVRTEGSEDFSVNELVECLYDACFIILAFMNARRKDEISHKAIGLHCASLKVVDSDLGLYSNEFYVEKTLKDYDTFWVTGISAKALSILGRLSEAAWSWSEKVDGQLACTGRERKLFVMPPFLSHTGKIKYYYFNASPSGISRSFVVRALGENLKDFRVAPHMFRRGYGLIHHYVYENSTLAALARKYRHFDIISPLHYVTNGAEMPIDAHAAARWSKPSQTVLDARKKRATEIKEEVDSVGKEKLHEFVESIISGESRYVGGFAKLVDRFNRHLLKYVEYSGLAPEEKAKKLSGALLQRGHMPHPYPHSTCMAGASRRGAACASAGVLARENASAVVCGGCTYSTTVLAHLAAMEDELCTCEASARDLKGTLLGDRAFVDAEKLKRILVLKKQRLGVTDENAN